MRDIMNYYEKPDAELMLKEEQRLTGDEFFDNEVTIPWSELRPKFPDFRGVVSAEKMKRDEAFIQKRQESHDLRSQSGRRLEECLKTLIAEYDWFGPEAQVVPAHEYDDLVNGTDMVVSFPKATGETIDLAVDVTTSPSSQELKRKIHRISDDLNQGKSPHIDYGVSPAGKAEGRKNLPRVVIGTDAQTAETIFAEVKETLQHKKEQGPKLAGNGTQRELLCQIERQLTYFSDFILESFLKYHGRESQDVLTKVRLSLADLKTIRLENEVAAKETNSLREYIQKNKEVLFKIDPGLSDTLFKHFDLIEKIQEIENEKSSQGIDYPGARNGTEEKLELPKSFLAGA